MQVIVTYIYFEVNFRSYWLIIPNNDVHTSDSLQDKRQNHLAMKYTSQWPTLILMSNFGSYWLIIPNNDVHTPKSLQDIRQNHLTMKCMSQWPTFILRSNIESYWIIIPNNDVHTSNSLEDTRQKSLDHKIYVTMTYIYFEVKPLVILIYYPK